MSAQWTPEQDALFSDNTDNMVSSITGYSLKQVAYRRRVLGIIRRREWTIKEEEKILRMRRAGFTYKEIADDIGRTVKTVQDRFAYIQSRGFYKPDVTQDKNKYACDAHLEDLTLFYGGKTLEESRARYVAKNERRMFSDSSTPAKVHVSFFSGSACGSPAQMCVS